MFAKLLVLCAVAAVALSIEYPPGVNPAVCPNYPYCDMSVLARFTLDGQPIPEWACNPYILPYLPLTTGAARYPADFNPALCPNYPYC